MFLFLILVGFISLFIGPSGVITDKEIILGIRLPRILLGIFVGGILGISGAVLQGVFKNRLVDPYFLGSATGGVFFLALFSLFFYIPLFLRPVFGFAGAFLTMLIVYLIASGFKNAELYLVLAGIAINFLLSGGIMIFMAISKRPLAEIIYALMGNLGFIFTKDTILVSIAFIVVVIGIVVFLLFKHRELDIASFEKESMYTLGVDWRRLLTEMFFATSIITGIAVAFAGSISFVGLVVPQIARLVLGEKHIKVLPASFIIGGLLLLLSDIPARTLFPFELPLSVVTSFIGVPFFIFLLSKTGYTDV